jgi:tRNA pseudouridine13 synthase
MALPYYTADLPGIGGQIKLHCDDFIVDEVPLYAASGEGPHCYFRVEKRNLSTMEAARLISQALGRRGIDVGYAGLKDTRAVTTQWFSVEHEAVDRVQALEVPHCKIVEVTRHRNKLKMGHLAGNRFAIKVRNPEWTRIGGVTVDTARQHAEKVWQALGRDGVPNFFGPQRFGMRHDNHLLGLALLTGNYQEFCNRFLGDPDESVDKRDVLVARNFYSQGKLEDALDRWPGHLRHERRALVALIHSKANFRRAAEAVDVKLRQLLVSALQSHLFNEVLTKRLPQMARILPGDMAWKHDNGAAFQVGTTAEDAAREQPRCDAHEISPSGPLFGYKMTQAEGDVGTAQHAVLDTFSLTLESFRGPAGTHGARRAMRFFPQDFLIATGEDERGPFVEFGFMLPSGCYATVLLGEIMKTDVTWE